MAVRITEYVRPRTLKAALELLAEKTPKTIPVGGGVSIVLSGAPTQVRAVDLHGLGLADITLQEHNLRVGAMATLEQLARIPEAAEVLCGVIRSALRTAGTQPMRNLITVGGNIVQCYYWSTLPPLLLALDARIHLSRAGAQRTVSADEFFAVHPLKFLAAGEIVTGVDMPLPKQDGTQWGASFMKCTRTSNDYAWVHTCALLQMKGGVVHRARLAVGALNTLPVRCPEGEQVLTGNVPDDALVAQAVQASVPALDVRADIRASKAYRRRIAGVYLERAIKAAVRPDTSCGR